MTTINVARLGSISHGTLRDEDLLNTFAYELEWLGHESDKPLIAEARAMLDDSVPVDENEAAPDLVNELIDALQERAPAYCYFGTNEGDGSDYGFWPIWNAIDELPHIQNVEGEEIPTEDHVYVNDHGNVTLYAADGSVIWDCV